MSHLRGHGTAPGQLPVEILVPVDAELARVGKVGTELDEEGSKVFVHAVKIIVLNHGSGVVDPRDGALALPEAFADGARHASLLLGDADKDDTLPRFELPQPLVHDIVFAHPFLKPDNRGCLSLGKVEHLPAKPLAHGHRFFGRSEPVALVAAEIGCHARCARQLRHIEVQIHSVDESVSAPKPNLEGDVLLLDPKTKFLSLNKILITGSSGLIGSEVVVYFCKLGWEAHGVDNNMRASFFGPNGDTRWNQQRLLSTYDKFKHHELDIRNRQGCLELIQMLKPDVIVHAAAQPSHDLAASRPFDDFDVNAVGTLNLLEAYRQVRPDGVFVHMSTNKVYGDAPNSIALRELDTRWDYADPRYENGIAESFTIDQSKHSLFGASKVAGDVYVQEYGRYFNMKTACLRGGCLTGPNHSGVELHGFLSYLVKCNLEGKQYNVFGYKGKQVRDNIHSLDVARAIHAFIEQPSIGAVYNIGGGRNNSCSIFEAFAMVEAITGKKQIYEYVEKNREGDHICYISDLTKMRTELKGWDISVSLPQIMDQLVRGWHERPKK